MTTSDNPLGDFLRARRELIDPADLDLPDYGRRRVKGLRREELALLAGVSSHYYARLEQGRDRHPSDHVLDALARVLGLNDEAAGHLRRLAQPVPPRRRRSRRVEKIRPGLTHLLHLWAGQPAVVVGRYRDVLAATDLAQVVNSGFIPGRNLLRHTFLDPEAREIYLDWEQIAEGAVAGLRASAGTELDDPRLTDLVGELSLKSEDFRHMWARHDVHERTRGAKRFNTPFVGEITLDYESFSVNGACGQTLFVFFSQPDSVNEQALTLLAGIARQRTVGGPTEAATAHSNGVDDSAPA
ncbi:helix-turn-helix domain-containing protein [Actinoallomurus rhizosphaericola]|uniref:helix-turn-helix domain-containing protein n=1 Tax=Actinoallomurus rhizosphaericola TaxID=2952536 RepID=UPI00209233FB|nr:helix-turn-helix transcriptional regulator [Actinoallomurus rhizosphaericola]MCO5995733.1 helix-turn-helix transcriptional regulator [Actinoallomurus rhizosphaericola]